MLAKDLVKICPFWSQDLQRMACTIRMTRDLVLIWQPPAPNQIGLIQLPDSVKAWNKPTIGVIVNAGPGWHDGKKFIKTIVEPGWVVIFDLMTPWRMDVETIDGKTEHCRYMGEQDIKAFVDPEQEIESIGTLISNEAWRRTKHIAHTRRDF